jgi:hypothetical protein
MNVNDELERMWREAIMTCFNVLSHHLFGEIDESHKKSVRIANFWIKKAIRIMIDTGNRNSLI